jgi:predicted nucleic acid-binding protein
MKTGKNDRWIVATAVVEIAELLATDKDFKHLSGEFLTVHYVDADEVTK